MLVQELIGLIVMSHKAILKETAYFQGNPANIYW